MRDRRCQLDMAHALAANARKRHLDTALLADDALVLHALVLAAQAFVVLDRAEDARAEQAVTLRLERAVVDGFGLLDLAVGPGKDLLGARDGNPDLVEDLRRNLRAEEVHDFLIHHRLLGRRGGPNFVATLSSPPRYRGIPGAAPRRSPTGSRDYSAASAVGPRSCLELCRSTLRPSERISFTSTLNDSGMPASNVSSPRTIAS